MLAHCQWCGRWWCGLGLLWNTRTFCSQLAHTPAYPICWGIQLLVPPLGNLLTLKSLTFRTSFSVFHCLPGLSISRVPKAITKTTPRDWRKLIKLMLRKRTFLLPRSNLIGHFIKRHLVTIPREQHVLARWLRQYFCQDHGVHSVEQTLLSGVQWWESTNKYSHLPTDQHAKTHAVRSIKFTIVLVAMGAYPNLTLDARAIPKSLFMYIPTSENLDITTDPGDCTDFVVCVQTLHDKGTMYHLVEISGDTQELLYYITLDLDTAVREYNGWTFPKHKTVAAKCMIFLFFFLVTGCFAMLQSVILQFMVHKWEYGKLGIYCELFLDFVWHFPKKKAKSDMQKCPTHFISWNQQTEMLDSRNGKSTLC